MRKCGTRTFGTIDRTRIDAILKGLTKHGALVSGNNPWDVETKNHGVFLRGEWNEETSELRITVTDASWYVPKKKIWEDIEALMRIVEEMD